MLKRLTAGFATVVTVAMTFMTGAYAQETRHVAMPKAGELGFQEPVNELSRELFYFHDAILMPIITVISLFVLALLVWIVFRYRAKANLVASKTTHSTILEVIWTGVPIIILFAIGFPSFKLLYFQDTIPETEFTINITGNQWNWTYAYPDHNDIEFTASLVPDADHLEGAGKDAVEAELTRFIGRPSHLNARLLDTDYRLVVPVNTKIKVQLTASDVLHSWTVPSFGLKLDAVPGRLNETWFSVDRVGTFYGQCSELCGKDHAFMPIAVEVVTKEEFEAWVERATEEFADANTLKFASAASAAAGK
jgi:cytochrome c oxidase subunit II